MRIYVGKYPKGIYRAYIFSPGAIHHIESIISNAAAVKELLEECAPPEDYKHLVEEYHE